MIEKVKQVRHSGEMEMLKQAVIGDTDAISKLFQYLSSPNSNLRKIIFEALSDFEGADLWKQLLSCMAHQGWCKVALTQGDMGEEARQRIDQAMQEAFCRDETETDEHVKEGVLRDGLYDPMPAIRYAAAYLLGMRGEASAIPWLSDMIDTADLKWQVRAVQALGHLQDRRCGPPLLRALTKDRSIIHREARRSLWRLGRAAQDVYLTALYHPDSHIRWHAARGLGEIGDARGLPYLAEGLRDEVAEVRWTSARVLSQFDAKAVPAILEALTNHDLNESFRQAAYHALHSMPSQHTRERLKPLLNALHGAAASLEAPVAAQRLLASWETSE